MSFIGMPVACFISTTVASRLRPDARMALAESDRRFTEQHSRTEDYGATNKEQVPLVMNSTAQSALEKFL